MPLAQHLTRPGAVYYWRRRIPRRLATCLVRRHLFLSLRTFSTDRARSLAAQLDAVLAEIVRQAETTFLSPPQLDAILRQVIAMHSAKLDRVAAAAKAAPFCDVGGEVRTDRRVGWVYRLLDAQGADAFVRPQTEPQFDALFRSISGTRPNPCRQGYAAVRRSLAGPVAEK
jgi:hypothetical protein